MHTTQTRLVGGALSAIMLSATLANAAPRLLIIPTVSGSVRIQQGLPCRNTLDVTTPITQGRMDLTWLPTTRPGTQVLVDLMRLTMFLSPFHVEATCDDIRGSVEFREIGLQLAGAVRFTADQTGGPESSLFRFRIPKERFVIYESVLDTAPVRQPEERYKWPSEDVTGLIDVRRQTVQLDVVLTSELRFRAGCEGARCRIDETHKGTATADVRAGDFARTPPTALCTPTSRPTQGFRVSASGDASITLGPFTLANNEVIQLLPTGEPGVRLRTPLRGDGIRQFEAGSGDEFIIATDSEKLSAITYCK